MQNNNDVLSVLNPKNTKVQYTKSANVGKTFAF